MANIKLWSVGQKISHLILPCHWSECDNCVKYAIFSVVLVMLEHGDSHHIGDNCSHNNKCYQCQDTGHWPTLTRENMAKTWLEMKLGWFGAAKNVIGPFDKCISEYLHSEICSNIVLIPPTSLRYQLEQRVTSMISDQWQCSQVSGTTALRHWPGLN